MSPYSRDHIPGALHANPRAVYRSAGTTNVLSWLVYWLVIALCMAGVVVGLTTKPLVFIGFFMLAYILENSLMFPAIHTLYHALFIERTEESLSPGQHYAFVHHYREPALFSTIWMDYRLQYVWNRDQPFAWTNFFQLYGVALATGALAWWSPRMALVFFSSFMVCAIFQGVCHEWYHVRDKRSFYTVPGYAAMRVLEWFGILDEKKHRQHHRHGLRNLEKVSQWVDCWSPFAESISQWLWAQALPRHEPGKERMVYFLGPIAIGAVALRFTLLVSAASVLIAIGWA